MNNVVTDDEPRTLYYVPEANYQKFEREIAKLSRKGERLGYGKVTPILIGYEFRDLRNDGSKIKCYEIFFTETVIKIDGWRFIATLDHSQETGNIVRSLPNTPDLPVKYRTSAPICEHCKIKRYRRDTYVLQCEETDQTMQIGRSCMEDFFGHDPHKMIKRAELLGFAAECARGYEQFNGLDRRYVELSSYLAQVAREVRLHGYITRKMVQDNPSLNTTAYTALDLSRYDYPELAPNEDDIKVAEAAQEWAAGLKDQPNLDEYLSNISVIGGATHVEMRSLGLAASIVGVWMRRQKHETDRLQRQAARDAAGRPSQHVGTVGERVRDIAATVTSIVIRERPDTYTLVIMKFLSTEGDEFVYFPTSKMPACKEGDQVNLTGTVKKHGDYQGALNTVLGRCTIGPRKQAISNPAKKAAKATGGASRGNSPVEARVA